MNKLPQEIHSEKSPEFKIDHVESIKITNFRGFFETKIIKFSVPTFQRKTSGLNIIVGENCTGKTTILELIKLLFAVEHGNYEKITSDSIFNDVSKPILVESKIGNQMIRLKTNSRNSVMKREFVVKKDKIINYYINDPVILNIPSKKIAAGNIINNNYRDSYNFLMSQQSNDNKIKREFNTNNDFLSFLITLESDEEKRNKFDAIFNEFLPDTTWTIRASDESPNGTIIKFIDEVGTSMFEGIGDGLVTILYITIGLYLLDIEKTLKILTIDEPEVSLHPQLLKKVGQVLSKYSYKHQIFISTHSPYLIDWKIINEGATLIRTVKHEGKLEIFKLNNDLLNGSTTSRRYPHAFGINANEVFFLSDKVILVEGQEDVICFREIIRGLGLRENDYNFFGWGVHGADNMFMVAKMLKSLGYLKVVMILDGDSKGLIASEKYRDEFPDYIVLNIPTDDIRDKEIRIDGKQIIGICNNKYCLKADFETTYYKDMEEMFEQINDYLGLKEGEFDEIEI